MGDLPAPPDKGCPCVVLRTGFETSQGQLMKTILFATERVTAGSDAETGVFLLILLVFAAVASAFVLKEVWFVQQCSFFCVRGFRVGSKFKDGRRGAVILR